MKKKLIYTTRAFLGWQGKTIASHMKIVQKDNAQVDVLHNLKSIKGLDFLREHSGLYLNNHFNLYGDFYKNTAINLPDWEHVYNQLNVDPLKKYQELWLIGGAFSWRSGFSRNTETSNPRDHHLNFVFPKSKNLLRFQSWGKILINMLALLKAHRDFGIPLHEKTQDPLEMSLDLFHPDYAPRDNYFLYHGYDIPRYKMKRLDSLQYHFRNQPKQKSPPKSLDFTFGYTLFKNHPRLESLPLVEQLHKKAASSSIFCRNDITGENTLVSKKIYMDHIARSRFTLILPAYDPSCFSVYRLIESLEHNCLPIIHNHCNVEELEKSFGVNLSDLIMEDLPTEARRLELLNYYRSEFLIPNRMFLN